MTILTQDEVFVNYDHVVKIQCSSDYAEIEPTVPMDVAVVKAYLDTGKKVILGVQPEQEQFEEVMADLTKWLNEKNDYKQVFEMPDPQIFIDDEDEEEDGSETESDSGE